jgi:hypothetical protein
MSNRDTSLIRVKFFLQNVDPSVPGTDTGSDVYVCLVDGPNWSGFTRGDVETTCSETTLDDWGNLIRTFRAGKLVDLGTVTLTVDWDADDSYGGREFAAFMDGRTGDLLLEFPAASGETTGPIITLTGYCNSFTPAGTVLSEDDSARSTAELVYKLNAVSYTAPV